MLRQVAVEAGRGPKAKRQSQTGEGVILWLGVEIRTLVPSDPKKHTAPELCVRFWVEEIAAVSIAARSGWASHRQA